MDTNQALNVFEEQLQPCCFDPLTGWHRDGFCNTDATDYGVHTVCIIATDEFLEFSKSKGNDLSTPNPWFPGLKAGDKWCLCADRWKEAFEAGMAPKVFLDGTHIKTLDIIRFEDLEKYSVYKV
jgi:uncharacterized protein (DUF2237 family)